MKLITFGVFLFVLLLINLSAASELLGQPGDNESLTLGNPSNAKTNLNQPDNYLVVHNGYSLSYNKSRGSANWVAWHLDKTDIGGAERTNAFAPDTILPRDWWILPTDYTGSGYDRGHLCPSKDRSSSEEANRVTFLMSNMQPQAPKLNQKTWKYLEDYTRETVNDNEAYVYAGCYGSAGKLKNKVTIPTQCWKIVVVLPEGDGDLKRINTKTRIIAVLLPNDETVSSRWRTYLTTVDDIETKTGYDFLPNVPKTIQAVIERTKDVDSESAGGAAPKTISPAKNEKAAGKPAGGKTGTGERVYQRGVRGGCYYTTESGKKSYVDKKFCEDARTAALDTKDEVKTIIPNPNVLPEEKPPAKNRSDGRVYVNGSRGGCYYLNSRGDKTYVNKKLCSN